MVACAPGVWTAAPAFAQPARGNLIQPMQPEELRQRQRRLRRPVTEESPPIVIEPTAPVANLFRRAEEGISRNDWKFTIDCLQRIIDEPEGSLMKAEEQPVPRGHVFESARRRAIERLASLPPEALRAYRLLHDGRAKRLFEQGRDAHDPQALHTILERFPLSIYADDAAELLASWALDAGRPGEVVLLLRDLDQLVPARLERDVPDRLIRLKLAAAYAMLGRDEAAADVLAPLREKQGPEGERSATSSPAVPEGDRRDILQRVLDMGPRPVAALVSSMWHLPGGSPSRRGVMPLVEPTLADPVPWQVALPGGDEDAWRRSLRMTAAGRLMLPLVEPVANGRHMFVRTPEGCVAVSRQDLSIAWVTELAEPVDTNDRRGRRRGPVPGDQGVAFDDYVAASLSLADGLLLTISRAGQSDYTQSRRDVRPRMVPWAMVPGLGGRVIEGTRLIALDQRTGRVVWSRGRTGEPRDPLGHVEFRSAPVEIEGRLWVPYQRDGELFLAVLELEDGSLLASVPLQAGRNLPTQARAPLPVAAGDGLVFVPSGTGLLFAVDTRDFSVRWANHFNADIVESPHARSPEGGGFLPSAPVVAGGTVVYAPPGEDELLAFDFVTGSVRWVAPIRQAAYIVGADGQRVWLAGRTVWCVSLASGELLWSGDAAGAPTGRAALSGDRIHVPTIDGLITFHADDGRVISERALPPSQQPLGNLLCLDHSLLATGSASIRSYPDVDRLYPEALAAYRDAPGKVQPALRLAWLELLRGRAQEAYDVLSEIAPGALEDDGERAAEVAHVRVEALLAMAGTLESAGKNGEAVLDLLAEARATARSPLDRLRCSLAIADQLEATGRPVAAYEQLWTIGTGPEGDALITLENFVTGAARLEIARRMARLGESLTPARRDQVTALTHSLTDNAIARLQADAADEAAQRQLRAIGALDRVSPAGQRALLALGKAAATRQQYGQAEQFLRQSIERDKERGITVSGLIALAEVYADAVPSGYATPSSLEAVLNELADRFGNTMLGSLNAELVPAVATPYPAAGMRVADWVNVVRSDAGLVTGTDRAERSAPLAFTGRSRWEVAPEGGGVAPRLVYFDGERPEVLAGRFVAIDPNDVLTCYDAADAGIVWRTPLRLPGEFHDFPITRWRDAEDIRRFAAADGQIGLFSGRSGLFAIELGTGRRLWFVPYEQSGEDAEPRDLLMDAADGVVAVSPRVGSLSLLRALDGSTIWERDMLGERMRAVRLVNDRLLTIGEQLERVHIFDAGRGRLVRRLLFRQPESESRMVSLVWTGGVLCGPDATRAEEAVEAVRIDNGERAWRLKVDKPLTQLFEPQPGYIGVSLLGGDVQIIDAATGEIVLRRRVAGAHAIFSGLMADGTLVMQHVSDRGGVRGASVSAMDVATDNALWEREDLRPLWISARLLRATGGRLPVAFQTAQIARNRRGQGLGVSMLDIRTGQEVGETVLLGPVSRFAHYNSDFLLFPDVGVAVIGGESSLYGLEAMSDTDRARNDF